MMYQVSIIVPAYNCEKYISRAIESLLEQTMLPEIILVDDGSNDQSPYFADEFVEKHNNIIVIHATNGGAAKARECGIKAAQGEYIAFLDSDDWVKSDFCEKMYGEAVRLDLDLIQCGFQNTDHYEMAESFFFRENTIVYDKWKALRALYGLESGGPFNYLLWNKLIKRRIIEQIPMPLEQRSQNDVPIVPKELFSCERIGYNPEPLIYYFHRATGNTESITDALWKSKGNAIFSHITAFNNVSQYFMQRSYEAYRLSLIHTLSWCLSAIKYNASSTECKRYAVSVIKNTKLLACKYLDRRKRVAVAIIKLLPRRIFFW